jgi:hypothetical protein
LSLQQNIQDFQNKFTCHKIVCFKYTDRDDSTDDIFIFKNNLFGLSVHKEFKDSNILIVNFYVDKLDYDAVSNLDFLEIRLNKHQDLITKYFENINIQDLFTTFSG